jgi:hypothetical protein
MPFKYIPLLILAWAPLAYADSPATTADATAAGSNSKSDELDAITADVVAKFNSGAPASAFDPLLARVGRLGLMSMRGMTQDPLAMRAYALQQFIAGWQDFLLNKDKSPETANNNLQQLAALSATLPVVPRSTLLGMMVKPDDVQAAKQKKANDQLAGLTSDVVAAVNAAKVPGDLDPVFAEISQAGGNRNDYSINSNKVQNLKYFVQNWQDYLSAVKDGRIADARAALHGLENPNYDASFYPRSKILDDLDALPAAPPPRMLSLDRPEMLTLDNLDEFIGQLEALRNNPAFQAMNEGGVEQAAVNLRDAYNQVKAGRGKEFLNNPMMAFNPYQTGRFTDALSALWLRLKLLAAPDAIDAPVDARPTDKDTLSSYLERMLVRAIAAKDWTMASKVLRTEQIVTPPQMAGDVSEDLVGIHALIVGTHHEAAGQWADAVAYYTGALDSTGPHLPVKELSDRLRDIQKNHPDDYAAGLKLPDPSRQAIYPTSPYAPRGMPAGFQSPQMPPH